MGKTWAGGGAGGDGDEAGIRGLGLTVESLGDSVSPDRPAVHCRLSSCDSSSNWRNLGGGELVSVAFKVETDKPDFAQRRSV